MLYVGLLAGLAVGTFSRTLTFLFGLLVLGVQVCILIDVVFFCLCARWVVNERGNGADLLGGCERSMRRRWEYISSPIKGYSDI